MAWENNDYRTYPVRCTAFHREAVLLYPELKLVGTYKHKSQAEAEARLLRKFRFLVRSHPGVDFSMDKLMEENTFRTRMSRNGLGDWAVLLAARPSISAELASLNPDLAEELQKLL